MEEQQLVGERSDTTKMSVWGSASTNQSAWVLNSTLFQEM